MIIASINPLYNLEKLQDYAEIRNSEIEVVVVDEGDKLIRKQNERIISGLPKAFFGPREREEWFKKRFASQAGEFSKVIPKRCHAETSFGFLVAYEKRPNFIIELDDDVFPIDGAGFFNSHKENISRTPALMVQSPSRWYNTIENLALKNSLSLFPRGHPFATDARETGYKFEAKETECVLNMGLWSGCLDLDALTILYHSSLDGRGSNCAATLREKKIVAGNGTYFAVCSMNTAFAPQIIPAFYQLYMKDLGIDRFDDIWSGLFLKKITDTLGSCVCLGQPLVYHDKRPRNTFNDLGAELEGMAINEKLWRMVDDLEINGKDYFDAYQSLISGLEKYMDKFDKELHRKFMKLQLEKMQLWLKVLDHLA
jgi:hypothetical protein